MVKQQWTICRYLLVASQSLILILFSVSLLAMSAISIDRLLSLLLGIRYRQIVTLKRAVLIVVAFWVMSLAGASSVFFGYFQISAWYGHILIALCLVTSTFSYAKIYQTLHQHRIQIQHQVHRDHLANNFPSEHGKIQNSSVHRDVDSVDIGSLLYSTSHRGSFSHSKWFNFICLHCWSIRTDFNFPELIIKPFLLLLEDWRSQASSKERSQANLLFSLLICIYWKCSFIF